MTDEAPLQETEHGRVAQGDGWFVLNARDAVWIDRGDRGVLCHFEHGTDFPQFGMHIYVLWPKQPMSMYHWEADQEDFLVLAGEALLVIEGEERPLRRWDFVHCPPEASHVIVGAGDSQCLVLAMGARDRSVGPDWGAYPVDETAARHGASVEAETTEPKEAYAKVARRQPGRFREDWLPE